MDGESRDTHRDVGYVKYQEREPEQGEEDIEDLNAVPQHKGRVTWQHLKERVMHGLTTVWAHFLSISYIPAIIFMMVSIVVSCLVCAWVYEELCMILY